MPIPAYAETIVGVGSLPDGNVSAAIANLAWVEVYTVDEETTVTATEITDEIGSRGPSLSSMDELIAAVGRELNAPLISDDRTLTHGETKKVIAVEKYR